ncbi:MAG: OmpA family protein [Candidatus Scalinduaceae bacterium]
MELKSSFVRCFLLSLTVISVGCAELKKLREDNLSLSQRLEEVQRDRDDLANKFALSEQERSRLIEERDRLERTRRDMEEKLRGTGATVRVKEGKIAVMLPSSIYFNSGKATLKKKAEGGLTKISNMLKSDFPNETIRIEGHTDNDPIKRTKKLYASNWELSAMRAASVLHFLVDKGKIDPGRLYIAGFGKYHPIASNKSKVGKKKNRRVEIVVMMGM